MEDAFDPGETPVAVGEMAGIEEVQDGAKPAVINRNGKKAESGSGGGSFFTWFIVLALLGVWTSVAVVYFDLVDYQGVLDKAKGIQINLSEALQVLPTPSLFFLFEGKLVAYDTDGDGDFDVEDAKILLDDQPGAKAGAKRAPSPAHAKLREALKLQLSLIHERVEAKKLARMALAEVRQLLAEEGEEARAMAVGRANMSERVRARVTARLREEEERMEREELEKALGRIRTEKMRKEEEERRKNTSRGEEERAKEKPKKNKAEKS